MATFYRGEFTELWITLSSNETLGVLDSDYIEDYYGVDGQITLRNLTTLTDYPVLMNEVVEETPSIAHDVFTGFINIASLPNGQYTILGRVRDILGNYTIFGEVENPVGGENILDLDILISEGIASGIVVNVGPFTLMGGLTLSFSLQGDVDLAMTLQKDLELPFVLQDSNLTMNLTMVGEVA